MPDIVKADLLDHELKKHVAAIHIENRLSLLERKMANVLLLNAYPNLLTQEAHRIRIKDLASILGFDSNDRDCLKRALVNLMSTVLTWNIIDRNGNEKAWRARPMLMSADIERNWCAYAYHPDLRQKMFNPEIYSRINLSIQRKFTSGYAFALYENCLRYRGTGSTGWWSLEVFRKLMGVGDNDYYADFRRLNSKLIKAAVKQVNQTSDIFLETETKSEKRRVVSIRFAIKDNPQMSLLGNTPKPQPLLPEPEDTDPAAGLRERLLAFGLREREANHFLKKYEFSYIHENLAIVTEMQIKGAIKTTLRAVALDALKTDYRPQKTPYEIDQEVRQAEEQMLEARRQEAIKRAEQYEELRREFEKHRLGVVLENLSANERHTLEMEFTQEITRGSQPTYTALRPIYQRHGLAHAAVHGCFHHFVRDRLLGTATDEEFSAFLNNSPHFNTAGRKP